MHKFSLIYAKESKRSTITVEAQQIQHSNSMTITLTWHTKGYNYQIEQYRRKFTVQKIVYPGMNGILRVDGLGCDYHGFCYYDRLQNIKPLCSSEYAQAFLKQCKYLLEHLTNI